MHCSLPEEIYACKQVLVAPEYCSDACLKHMCRPSHVMCKVLMLKDLKLNLVIGVQQKQRQYFSDPDILKPNKQTSIPGLLGSEYWYGIQI